MNTEKQHIDPNKEAANSVATDEYESTLQALINENISLRYANEVLAWVPDLVTVFDMSGRIDFVSQSVVQFLDLKSGADMEGTFFWDVISEKSRDMVYAALRDAATEAAEAENDFVLLADGMPIQITFSFWNKRGYQETRCASLRGTVFAHEGYLECIAVSRLQEARASAWEMQYENQIAGEESEEVVQQVSDNDSSSGN